MKFPIKFFDKQEPKKVKDVSNQPKTVSEILQEQSQAGLDQYRRSTQRLFASSFSAGLELGFSLFLIGIFYTLFHGKIEDYYLTCLIAVAYSLGFIFVVIGRSELFTEHTTLAVIPVLQGITSIKSLLKIWIIIYIGNLLGGYLFSFIFVTLGPAMGIISKEAFYHLAIKMVDFNWAIILGSSIIAGWLMGLLSWLVTSAQETISRIIIVALITTVIGFGGLHHSIAGSIEVFAGTISDARIKIGDYFHFQSWTTLGNIIGGVVFVAIMKYTMVEKNIAKENSDES